MKNLFALLLAASMLLAGCAQKAVTNDHALEEVAPAPEQESPLVAEEETRTEMPMLAAVAQVPEPTDERLADKIFFEFNSHRLSTAGEKALEGHTAWLLAEPEVHIVIEGHADERGSEKYNLNLGKKRAQAARDYLVARGIAPERLATISFGEEKASRGAGTERLWSQDRRVEFVAAN